MHPGDISNVRPVVHAWLSQDTLVHASHLNPAHNSIIDDTGALLDGFYDFMILGNGNANHYWFAIEHRNLTNLVTLSDYPISIAAFAPSVVYMFGHFMALGERLRIRTINAAAGQFTVHISWHRRYAG